LIFEYIWIQNGITRTRILEPDCTYRSALVEHNEDKAEMYRQFNTVI